MNKGQAWIQDGISGLVIVFVAFGLFLSGYINLQKSGENTFRSVYETNIVMSDYLMLPGTPNNWNESNVLRIGLLNKDYTINETKLEMFYNLTTNNYNDTKEYLKTIYDYMVFFTQNNTPINISGDIFIGKPYINITNINNMSIVDSSIISKTERYVIRNVYNGTKLYKKIIKMNVYSWKENE